VAGGRGRDGKEPEHRHGFRLDVRRWQETAGDLKLQPITAAQIEAARDAMMKSVSPKSVKNALGTLRVAFNWAVRHEVLSRNVATSVKPPMVERFESHWASQSEAKRLLAIFERNDPPYGPMLAIALLTCLRVESEWGAMRWRDVDLKAKTASLVRVRLQDGSIIPAGNSKHKRRLVALSDEAVRFLEIQRKWQARMCDAKEGPGSMRKVWCSPRAMASECANPRSSGSSSRCSARPDCPTCGCTISATRQPRCSWQLVSTSRWFRRCWATAPSR
jgi:integrase